MDGFHTNKVIDMVLAELKVVVEGGVDGPVAVLVVAHREAVGLVDTVLVAPGLVVKPVGVVAVIQTHCGFPEQVLGEIHHDVSGHKERFGPVGAVCILGEALGAVPVSKEAVVDGGTIICAGHVYIVAVIVVNGNGGVTEKGVTHHAAALVVLVTVSGRGQHLVVGVGAVYIEVYLEPVLDLGIDAGADRGLVIGRIPDNTLLVEVVCRDEVAGFGIAAA